MIRNGWKTLPRHRHQRAGGKTDAIGGALLWREVACEGNAQHTLFDHKVVHPDSLIMNAREVSGTHES